MDPSKIFWLYGTLIPVLLAVHGTGGHFHPRKLKHKQFYPQIISHYMYSNAHCKFYYNVDECLIYYYNINHIQHGLTPLILATKLKNVKLIEVLHDNGADVNAKTKEVATILLDF